MRRLLLLSLIFAVSSCAGSGSGSGFSCHGHKGGIYVGLGSDLDASGVHHGCLDNSSDDGPSDSGSPVSEIDPDSHSPDDSPGYGPSDEVSSPDESSNDGPSDSGSPVSEIDPDSHSPDDSPNYGPSDEVSSPGDQSSDDGSATFLTIWDGNVYDKSSDFFVPVESSPGSPATSLTIWDGKVYEPSDCITVMWGYLCLNK